MIQLPWFGESLLTPQEPSLAHGVKTWIFSDVFPEQTPPEQTSMATAKQIDANRRNAQKSTGPKTEEGRDRVRRNALKHGMTARTVLPQEDPGSKTSGSTCIPATCSPAMPSSSTCPPAGAAILCGVKEPPKAPNKANLESTQDTEPQGFQSETVETAGQKQSQFFKGEAKSVPILHEGSPTALTKEERIARWNNGCLAFTGASGDDRWKSFFRPVIDQPVDECPDARDE